ncbi:MAG: hypothetical protein GX781_02605 [Clostridiales bacterium]|nr:hypothetical protein [Clostridiales bacterium]
MKKPNIKRKLKISLITLSALIILLVGGFYVYTLDYYHAQTNALQAFLQSGNSVPAQKNMTVFHPAGAHKTKTGIIFYPGGKVEAKAYAPLLAGLANKGYSSVLIDMPLNLAIFGINQASKVYQTFPEIEHWFLSGHSLGGAMASSYSQKHSSKLSGLILLGAYPLNKPNLPTLAIYGTFDQGIDQDKLFGVDSVEISGGNHAYFGDYGEQKGDGTAGIQRKEQQHQTIEAIDEFIKKTLLVNESE